MIKRFVSFAVCFAVLLCGVASAVPITPSVSAAAVYTGPYVQVGDVTLPLENHMPGTFFTKNGQACTNHANADCIANGSDCNCMRYYPTGKAETCEIDLLAVQCYGFARLVFYKCFGFLDHPTNASRYHNVGSLSSSAVSESSIKSLLSKAAPGAHVRLTRGHSVSILEMTDDYIIIYHANSGGDNVPHAYCVVSTIKYTWAEFATYARHGVDFVNMPNSYPGWETTEKVYTTGLYKTTDYLNLRAEANTNCEIYLTIPVDTEIEVTEVDGEWGKVSYNGYNGWVNLSYAWLQTVSYVTTDYLNLRAEPNTSCTIYLTIPQNTVIEVSTVENGWGKTSYGGYNGWVSMQYTSPLNKVEETLTPENSDFALDDKGFLKGVGENISVDLLKECFASQNIKIISPSGENITSGGTITTGTKVQLISNGNVIQEVSIAIAGDVNMDGRVQALDYLAMKRIITDSVKYSDLILIAGDLTGDGIINSADYLAVRRYYLLGDTTVFDKFK